MSCGNENSNGETMGFFGRLFGSDDSPKRILPGEQPTGKALESDRYRCRPLFLLLESYILDCVGELSPEKQRLARTAVQQVWGGDEDWKATLRQVLHLDVGIDKETRTMWAEHKQWARENQTTVSPTQFAMKIADANFGDMEPAK